MQFPSEKSAGVGLAALRKMAVPPMTCPTCDHDGVSAHPESSPNIAFYDCPKCGQEWSARFHGDRPFVVLKYSQSSDDVSSVDPIVLERFRLRIH